MDARQKYKRWMECEELEESLRQELLSIQGDESEIYDRFYRELEFGTGGLRGIIGAGTNRMNRYTVLRATQGLANVILQEEARERGVAIAYDSRRMSEEFSEQAALCLNANGIKTYRFESLRPTPELSFAVRKLGCIAGIVITASHNPPEYNGYKVYWEDGAQITAPRDKQIITQVNAIEDYFEAKSISRKEAQEKQLYHTIGKEIDDAYMQELHKLSLNQECIRDAAKELKIVYTPLHGTGNLPVRRILAEMGFENVYVVPEQECPDGNFPTVDYPNPEDPKAFALALETAKAREADLILATDPDADRLGVYAKDVRCGEWKVFTGNMSGLLLAEYILSQKREQNRLPKNGALIKTIVSSEMAKEMAKEYQITLIEVLTGFKYIGEQIRLFEETNAYEYVFGYEESYGCLSGTYARDKDAVAAVMMLCEAAAYYRMKGLTLWDQMMRIYDKYGYYKEELVSITKKGEEGSRQIQAILNILREKPPSRLGEFRVLAVRDYQKNIRKDLQTNQISTLDMPKSNVLYYEMEQQAWCCIRPSGTEPKIKFYIGVKGSGLEDAEAKLEGVREELMKQDISVEN